MPSNKIVLDTNCLLVSISKYGEAYFRLYPANNADVQCEMDCSERNDFVT